MFLGVVVCNLASAIIPIGLGCGPEATKRHGNIFAKCVKVLDMNGLKLSALNQLKLLQTILTVDDLNYPEKTITYCTVNVPYVFSACWKVRFIISI
ncbi:putative CRAL-TRIO lipid binding domain-containing protein [Helianthus anomalus]